MRVHLLAPPNTTLTKAYALDGFCQRTILFAELLKRLGHQVWIYAAGEGIEAPCDSFISCLSTDEYHAFVQGKPYQNVPFDGQTPLYLTFNHRAAQAIRHTKQGGDVIASITGSAQYLVSEYNPDLIALEYSIGYQGVALPFRVFQSHAWRHAIHGRTQIEYGRTFDTVVPPWFHVADFPFNAEPREYLVYCGRLTLTKGIHTVCEVAKASGVPLVCIGHGDPKLITYGEYVGAVSTEERNRILSGARACLMPTEYVEAFGNVAAEAQLCGTPVISTDFGAFVESVEHGKTGYRCCTLGEFVQAIDLSKYLDRSYIRSRAVSLYSEDAAAESYAAYFTRMDAMQRAGWNSLAHTLDVVSLADLEGVV